MNDNTPISEIAAILGHTSAQSTRQYVWSNISQLRTAASEVPAYDHDKEFLVFQEGIFKPYFEKYIEFKRGKGEKVSQSTLVRLRGLNESLNRCSNTLDTDRNMLN